MTYARPCASSLDAPPLALGDRGGWIRPNIARAEPTSLAWSKLGDACRCPGGG